MKIMLKIKPFQETLNDSMCGPASLKIVLQYYGIDVKEKELAKIAEWNKDLGIDDRGIEVVAKHFGFKVKIKNNKKRKSNKLLLY